MSGGPGHAGYAFLSSASFEDAAGYTFTVVLSLTRMTLIPPEPLIELATTHAPPGTTTRSSGPCWPQTNRVSAVSTHGPGGAGAGGCADADAAQTMAIAAKSVFCMAPIIARERCRARGS